MLCYVTSVVSDSVRPHRRQPTRLPRPWDSPGKNTGVGCHFLLQCMKMKSESEVAQSCLTLSDPMDCSLPGSSIHGIFQATVLEWGANRTSISQFSSVQSLSHVRLFASSQTAARQAPLSLEFSRQTILVWVAFILQYKIKRFFLFLSSSSRQSRTRLGDFTFTFHFHALEKEMATHFNVLAWRSPGTGKPGGLPSMGSQRVGHD